MAQWLDRIKYGNGHDGSPAVTGTINTYAACTGTATQTSLTTALAASAGDCILIHQSQGTGAGQWELNYVLADAGATLTLAYPLAYTYGTGAQAVIVPQYTGGTLSGAVTATSWNGTVGGIIALMCNGDLVVTGSITAPNGFRGGAGSTGGTAAGTQGESEVGTGSVSKAAKTTNGGGGGAKDLGLDGSGGGGGGGHASAGITGVAEQGSGGVGGGSIGVVALTTIFFGGGGGGNGDGARGDHVPRAGGAGKGIIFIFAKTLTTSSGSLVANGNAGESAPLDSAGGGGGAGGSILIKCQSAVLGTNTITATGGAGGSGSGLSGSGGAGSVGRIHVDYADSYSGSTTPTIDATQVASLKSQIYGGII